MVGNVERKSVWRDDPFGKSVQSSLDYLVGISQTSSGWPFDQVVVHSPSHTVKESRYDFEIHFMFYCLFLVILISFLCAEIPLFSFEIFQFLSNLFCFHLVGEQHFFIWSMSDFSPLLSIPMSLCTFMRVWMYSLGRPFHPFPSWFWSHHQAVYIMLYLNFWFIIRFVFIILVSPPADRGWEDAWFFR